MRKKIIIHCQYVYGIGHFVRTIQLATKLSSEFDVFILNGGQIINNFPIDAKIKIINIPAIYKNEELDQLLPVDEQLSLKQCFEKRLRIINETLSNIIPDIIITEHFPFGFLFKDEALSYINEARRVNPNTKVVASVREVIENNIGNPNDHITVEILNKYYDLLLVHGDENILSLRNSFPLFDQIKINNIHTGYIVQELNKYPKKNEKINILASVGAGRLGSELLQKVLDSYKFLDNDIYKLTLFIGAFQENTELCSTNIEMNNIEIFNFDRDLYLSKLSCSDLVISLGGYNSVIEAISLNKKLLVYNREFVGSNLEQDIRINKFKDINLLDVFTSQINPMNLAYMIDEIILKPNNNQIKINFNGSFIALEIIKKI